jgi:hypothetical protein
MVALESLSHCRMVRRPIHTPIVSRIALYTRGRGWGSENVNWFSMGESACPARADVPIRPTIRENLTQLLVLRSRLSNVNCGGESARGLPFKASFDSSLDCWFRMTHQLRELAR